MMDWIMTDLKKLKLRAMLSENESLTVGLTRDITKQFRGELKYRTKGVMDSHIVLFIHGETGSFKSSTAQEIALLIQEDFSATQIVFENEALLKVLEDSKEGQVFIRDESLFDFGVGSMRSAKEIQIISETLRKRKNSLIFIAPTMRNIGSAHYILYPIAHTKGFTHIKVGVQEPRREKFLGYIILKVHKDGQVWKDYSKLKSKFLDDIIKRDRQVLDIEGMAGKLLEAIDLNKYSKKKERALFVRKKHPNLTTQENQMLLTQLEMMIREQNG